MLGGQLRRSEDEALLRRRAHVPGGRADHAPDEEVEEDEEGGLESKEDRLDVHPVCSNTSSVRPRTIWSPGSRRALSTRSPFTSTPFVEPRSTIHQPPSSSTTSAWRRETLGSSILMSQSRERPRVSRSVVSTWRFPCTLRRARASCASPSSSASSAETAAVAATGGLKTLVGLGAGAPSRASGFGAAASRAPARGEPCRGCEHNGLDPESRVVGEKPGQDGERVAGARGRGEIETRGVTAGEGDWSVGQPGYGHGGQNRAACEDGSPNGIPSAQDENREQWERLDDRKRRPEQEEQPRASIAMEKEEPGGGERQVDNREPKRQVSKREYGDRERERETGGGARQPSERRQGGDERRPAGRKKGQEPGCGARVHAGQARRASTFRERRPRHGAPRPLAELVPGSAKAECGILRRRTLTRRE